VAPLGQNPLTLTGLLTKVGTSQLNKTRQR